MMEFFSVRNILRSLLNAASEILDNIDENVIIFGGIGRCKRVTVYNMTTDIVNCGCFEGSLAQFEDQIRREHKNAPHHLQEYLAAVEFIRAARVARLKYPPIPKEINDHAADVAAYGARACCTQPNVPGGIVTAAQNGNPLSGPF